MKTAILIDGGFYRKRAAFLWGKKTPESRAKELYAYCMAHFKDSIEPDGRANPNMDDLYRIFYYDCPPLDKTIYHPLLKKGIDFGRKPTYAWTIDFLQALKEQRKVALRLGTLSDARAGFALHQDKLKKLLNGSIQIEDLTEADFDVNFEQKGVDMKIGIDIASMAYKHQVRKMILISGDSDFVPAAKLARREGIDFVLDPMWAAIKSDLQEHIDGLHSQWGKKDKKNKNKMCHAQAETKNAHPTTENIPNA